MSVVQTNSAASPPAAPNRSALDALLERRTAANDLFFAREADRIARLCHAMAERFARGGRLVAFGASPAANSDARHVAVEFVHPVIVGKRALPALALTRAGGALADQVDLLVGREDLVIGFDDEARGGDETRAALAVARRRGCLTMAFSPAGAEWEFELPTTDPFVHQELVETLYHLLWELVHVFFEHRGLLEGRTARSAHGAGASNFLYPFLAEGEHDLEAVLDDVGRSVRLKADEIRDLRIETVRGARDTLTAASAEVRASFDAGGRLLALGNGGSATDAMDIVADFRAAPQGWPPRPALDLTEDPAVLTAIANDIGTDLIFARQIIAYGRAGDTVVALSTSGNSRNVIRALQQARELRLRTVALVGYDGGRVQAEGLADRVIVTPSQHVPRIQEAQATTYHLLRELIELA